MTVPGLTPPPRAVRRALMRLPHPFGEPRVAFYNGSTVMAAGGWIEWGDDVGWHLTPHDDRDPWALAFLRHLYTRPVAPGDDFHWPDGPNPPSESQERDAPSTATTSPATENHAAAPVGAGSKPARTVVLSSSGSLPIAAG